jgi:hypothetical protein
MKKEIINKFKDFINENAFQMEGCAVVIFNKDGVVDIKAEGSLLNLVFMSKNLDFFVNEIISGKAGPVKNN